MPPKIDGFKIIRAIGRGGMGVVYEAVEETLSRRVALKILPGAALDDSNRIRRFEREAKAAARLHHTNIVPVFGVGHQDGHPYYVMQYIEGSSLDRVVAELRRSREAAPSPPRLEVPRHADGSAGPETVLPEGAEDGFRNGVADVARSLATGSFVADEHASPQAPATDGGPDETTVLPAPIVPEVSLRPRQSSIVLPGSSEISAHPGLDRPYFTRVARIGRQVAEALEYANRQGVLHRDIKPSNLLLDTAGNVWVADFGLAKTADADDLTVTGDLVGTLRYMAPERFQGQCDARSDVYSLGLSLYELVALHPAFMETDRYKLIERIRREQPVPLKKLAPKVPRDLETIIHKAIAIEPPRRYATAAALADDLRRFLEDQPIQARRASRAERVARWCRQNPWVAVSFVILCLGTTISVWQAIRARTAEATARTERTRAESEAETAKAVNEFLNKDLLAQASAHNQAVPNAKPDPDLKVRTALDRAAATIGERFAGRPVLEASIRQTIGETYEELGLYPNAKIHLERALELRRRELGPNHPDTFIAMESLSKLHLADDRLAEAEPLLRQALEGLRRVRGDDDPDTLNAMSGIAQLYYYQEKLDAAEEALNQLLNRRLRVRGPDHPETLETTNNLAMVYFGQYQAAHAAKAPARAEEKLAQAERLLVQVIDRFERQHRTEHPATLATKTNLAMVHNARGKTATAERLLNEVLDVQRRVLGNKHPDTLVTMVTLGELSIYQRKLDQAERLLVEAVEGSRTALDRNSQTIAAALSLLGAVYANKGDLKKLGPVLIESRDIARFRWGPDHGLTAAGNQAVGLFFRAEKDYAKAEPFFRDSLGFWLKTSPDNWNRYLTESLVGLCLLNRKQDAEAERLLFSAYKGLKAREKDVGPAGKDHVQTTVDLIIQLYNRSRRLHDEADLQVVRSNPDFQVITMDLKFPADPFARP